MQKAAEKNPRSLQRLSQLSKAFRDSAWRCSRALVLRSVGGRLTSETDNLLAGEEICTALTKQMSLRPKLSKLVIARGAEQNLRQVALTSVQWSSVEADTTEVPLEPFIELLLPFRESVQRLDLDYGQSSGGYDRDIAFLVQAFPNLETLTLRGRRRTIAGSRTKTDSANNKLASLDFANIDFHDLRDVSDYLPNSLCCLRSLRLRWGTYTKLSQYRNVVCLQTPLTLLETLRLDALDGRSMLLLNNVAEYCPSLKRLLVHLSPQDTTALTCNYRGVGLKFPPLMSERCPDLEQIVISRGEVVTNDEFVELLRKSGLQLRPGSRYTSKILILEEGRIEGTEACSPLCSVRVFRCIVSLNSRWIDWDSPDT